MDLAVVIPVGPGDRAWEGLCDFLAELPATTQVVFSACEKPPASWPPAAVPQAQWLQSPPGRALQLNRGSECTSADFLWWLHADSRPSSQSYAALLKALQQRPQALHWFSLRFLDGPRLARWNAAGANWRSRRWSLPFGDQGLCLSRRQYQRVGGYDELVGKGEDLSLVLRLRHLGVELNEVPAWIGSSARRYSQKGWLRTTFRHLWLTWALSRTEKARIRADR